MKRMLIFACMLVLAGGCVSGAKKRFTLIVEPPDAEITVMPGGGQPERNYRSPADITVQIPEDTVEAAKGRLVIKRETYKPMTIILSSIKAETMRLQLSKLPPTPMQYRMQLRMTHPRPSDDLSYRDKILAIRISPEERQFTVRIQNLAGRPIKILWDLADYTDYWGRPHRIIHPDVKPEKRERPMPSQEIPAGGSLVQAFIPNDMAAYSKENRVYESKPIFPLEDEKALGLRGKTFLVALPVEIDRSIIPDYRFQFEIVDVVKQ